MGETEPRSLFFYYLYLHYSGATSKSCSRATRVRCSSSHFNRNSCCYATHISVWMRATPLRHFYVDRRGHTLVFIWYCTVKRYHNISEGLRQSERLRKKRERKNVTEEEKERILMENAKYMKCVVKFCLSVRHDTKGLGILISVTPTPSLYL